MDDKLLNTSWTIHAITTSNTQYRTLLTSSQETLDIYARSLKDYFDLNTTQYRDDLTDGTERTGVLKECKFTSLDTLSTQSSAAKRRRGVLIEFGYTKATYSCVLYNLPLASNRNHTSSGTSSDQSGSGLVLTRLLPPAQKLFLRYLDDKFSAELISPFRLQSTLLLSTLQNYVRTISSIWTIFANGTVIEHSINSTYMTDNNDDQVNTDGVRTAILKSVLSTLKLTVTMSSASGVAPDLRSIEIEVPSDTLNTLLTTPAVRSHSLSSSNEDNNFLERLRDHIRQRTGLILPLTTKDQSGQDERSDDVAEGNGDAPFRVTRITCAAFAISVEGRVKFASKPVEGATQEDAQVIRKANEDMLDAILQSIKVAR